MRSYCEDQPQLFLDRLTAYVIADASASDKTPIVDGTFVPSGISGDIRKLLESIEKVVLAEVSGGAPRARPGAPGQTRRPPGLLAGGDRPPRTGAEKPMSR